MVFGLFRRSGGEADSIASYADVRVVTLAKSAYYADDRERLLKILGEAVESSPTGKVVVDMGKVKQFTSGPLGALVVSARKSSDRGGRLLLAASVTPFVAKVLTTAMESSANTSYATVRAALAALSTEAASSFDKAH